MIGLLTCPDRIGGGGGVKANKDGARAIKLLRDCYSLFIHFKIGLKHRDDSSDFVNKVALSVPQA